MGKFIETKALYKGLQNGLEQLKSYMGSSNTCRYGIVMDGNELIVMNRNFEVIDDIHMFNISMMPSSVQNYLYLDLRYNRKYTLLMDETRNNELTVKDGNDSDVFYKDDLKMLNVFSSIAAGKPIYMSGDVEEQFPLPLGLIPGNDGHFILKVKGDSMERARIKNGDWVVIKNQQTAENRDIVAVAIDEDATLKRFMKMGDSILLIPENEKYEPIHIRSDQARIIGVAVGIIKKGN